VSSVTTVSPTGKKVACHADGGVEIPTGVAAQVEHELGIAGLKVFAQRIAKSVGRILRRSCTG